MSIKYCIIQFTDISQGAYLNGFVYSMSGEGIIQEVT